MMEWFYYNIDNELTISELKSLHILYHDKKRYIYLNLKNILPMNIYL